MAGTWKQYSTKAISQLITMTFNNGDDLYLRWPYQAKVIKMLEAVKRISGFICNVFYKVFYTKTNPAQAFSLRRAVRPVS